MGSSIRFDRVPDLQLNKRIGARYPGLAAAGFHFARWLARLAMGGAGFHQLGSDFARERLARVQEKLRRGETVFLAGLGLSGTHNSGVALCEVSQANGPRLIVNNEEERFSGNKHTTEYPKASIDAMVATLRGMGRDIGDIDAWLTSWDYPDLAGTLARSVLEELPQSLKLLPHRHVGPPRQGRRHPTGVRGCDDPCGRSSPADDRRDPAGAHRR